VFLDCGDGYQDLPEKVKAILQWAYDQGYDYVAKLDDDTVLRADLWYQSFPRSDFSGWVNAACRKGEIRTPWGFLYILSRRAMKIILESPLPNHGNDEAWVSTMLYTQGIYVCHDPHCCMHTGTPKLPKKRSLRFNRPSPFEATENVYAWCIYMNHNGWHKTEDEEILSEFQKVWEKVK
jgi:hypothetical protein